MQIVSLGDDLHEISKSIFLEKIKNKYFKMSTAKSFARVLDVYSEQVITKLNGFIRRSCKKFCH